MERRLRWSGGYEGEADTTSKAYAFNLAWYEHQDFFPVGSPGKHAALALCLVI